MQRGLGLLKLARKLLIYSKSDVSTRSKKSYSITSSTASNKGYGKTDRFGSLEVYRELVFGWRRGCSSKRVQNGGHHASRP
jgi:hypothetical protein